MHRPGQQQQQQQVLPTAAGDNPSSVRQLPWLGSDDLPTAAPASPSISDMIMEDLPLTDASELAAAATVAGSETPRCLQLTPPAPYESSLLFLPASVKTKQQQQQQQQQQQHPLQQLDLAAGAGSSGIQAASGSLQASNAPLLVRQQQQQHGPEQRLSPLSLPGEARQAADGRRKPGSSCGSSSAADAVASLKVQHAGGISAAAAGPVAKGPAGVAECVGVKCEGVGIKAEAGCMFSEEDRRLLDQLLAESADLIGTALQPTAAAALEPHASGKRVRGAAMDLLQQPAAGAETALPLSVAACSEHAMPLPSIALLPPIAHRDDSAEDNRLCRNGGNSSSDSAGSTKRQKNKSNGTRQAQRPRTQEVQAVQLIQQQSHYQQLQALQEQLQQQSMLAVPCAQQQHLQQQMMRAGAAAGPSALQMPLQNSMYEEQLQELMQCAGLAAATHQQGAGVAAAVSGVTSAMCISQGGQGFWGLAQQAAAAQGGNSDSQLQLLQQHQQQQQYAMAQYMSGYGCMPAINAAAGYPGNYGSDAAAAVAATMGPGTAWGLDAAAAAAPAMLWPVQQLGLQPLQQQHTGQSNAMTAVLAAAHGGGLNASYHPADTSLRMSVKIHGAQPNQLQQEMLPRLNALLGSDGRSGGGSTLAGASPGLQVECGYMRPGCVHLVLQLRSPADLRTAVGALAAAERGLDPSSLAWALLNVSASSSGSSSSAAGHQQLSITVQLGNRSVLLVQDGKPDAVGAALLQSALQQQQAPRLLRTLPASGDQLLQAPQLYAVIPCCVSSRSAAAGGRCRLLALGSGLKAAVARNAHHPQDLPNADPAAGAGLAVLLARCQGVFLSAEVSAVSPLQACALSQLVEHAAGRSSSLLDGSVGASDPASAADRYVAVVVHGLQPYGLVHLEVMQGLLLSESRPLLVVDDDAVAAELHSLQPAVMAGGQRQLEAHQVLSDFGRLLDFRAAAERCAANSRAAAAVEGAASGREQQPQQQQQQQQQGPRPSNSEPLPLVDKEAASSAGGAPYSCGNVVQPAVAAAASTGGGSSGSAWPAAGAAASPDAAGLPSRNPSRGSSSSSLCGGLLASLPFFAAGRRTDADSSATSSVVNRRRSFALETVLRQQEMRQGKNGDGDRAPLCFPTGRRGGIRASLSFSRRRSFGLDAAVGDAPAPASSTADDATVSRCSSLPLPPGGKRVGSSSTGSTSASGISRNNSIGASSCRTDDRQHSFAVDLAQQQAGAAADSATSRRKSFGGFVVSSSRSFRAFTRNLTCGSFAKEQHQEDVATHAPGVRFASDPGLLRAPAAAQAEGDSLSSAAAMQHQQRSTGGMRASVSLQSQQQQLDDGGNSADDDPAWAFDDVEMLVDGDSVSSFAPGPAAAAPATVQEHPLLTMEYKSLMMCAFVSLALLAAWFVAPATGATAEAAPSTCCLDWR
jgi:hypothetical protein